MTKAELIEEIGRLAKKMNDTKIGVLSLAVIGLGFTVGWCVGMSISALHDRVVVAPVATMLPASEPLPAATMPSTVSPTQIPPTQIPTPWPTFTPVPRPTVTPVPSGRVCLAQAQDSGYATQLQALSDEWAAAVIKATSAPSLFAMADPVVDLIELREEVRALEPPLCAQGQHLALVAYMDATVDAFVLYLAGNDDAAAKMDLAVQLEKVWEQLMYQTFGLEQNTSFYSG